MGYDKGYAMGHAKGYAKGYEKGTGRGYDMGQAKGYARGYEKGYAKGYGEGKEKGYVLAAECRGLCLPVACVMGRHGMQYGQVHLAAACTVCRQRLVASCKSFESLTPPRQLQ